MAIYRIENAGDIGVVRDMYPHEIPDGGWSDSRNMRFRLGYAEKMRGHNAPLGTPTVAPYWLHPFVTSAGARYWVYAGLDKIYYVDNASVHSNITRQSAGVDVDYTGDADDRWVGDTLSGVLLATNGVDVPQYWAGTGRMLPFSGITGWSATTYAKIVRAHRNYIITCNITDGGTVYPYMVWWSNPAEPGALPTTFDYAGPTESNRSDLAGEETPIVDALSGPDGRFYIYTETGTHALDWIGAPYVWQFNRVTKNGGALSQNCVVNIPGGQAVFGQGDIYYHQGGEPISLVSRKMRRWIYNQLDASYYGRSFVARNPLQNEVWFCFVAGGDTSAKLALVWNHEDNTLGVRELPNASFINTGVVDGGIADSWNGDSEAWNDDDTAWNQPGVTKSSPRIVIASGADTKLLLADQSRRFESAEMDSYVLREGMALGDPLMVKTVRKVRPVIEGTAGGVVQVQVGAAMDLAAGTTWEAAQNFTIGSSTEVDCFATGRYLALKLRSNSNINWRVRHIEMDVVARGNY